MSLAQFMNQNPCMSLESHLDQIAIESEFMVNMLETFKNSIPSFYLKYVIVLHLYQTQLLIKMI